MLDFSKYWIILKYLIKLTNHFIQLLYFLNAILQQLKKTKNQVHLHPLLYSLIDY